jgi:hypothetical protein
MRLIFAFLAVLLVPACSGIGGIGGSSGSSSGAGGPLANPDTVTLDVANSDAVPYNLATWEFWNGAPLSEVHICWPIAGKSGVTPTQEDGSVNVHADSSFYSHSVVLYDLAGNVLDTVVFIKGIGPLLLVITIQAGKMTVASQ